MKIDLLILTILLIGASACDGSQEDTVPPSFSEIKLNPDEIYVYNSGNPGGTRLDALLNDSIKVDATITYGTPLKGAIAFVPDDGWFYQPDEGFVGDDKIEYKVCQKSRCVSTEIIIHVENPLDAENCLYEINGETVQARKNTPLEIRPFFNDVICPFMGFGMYSPEKGTFSTYSYAGSYKNNIYVYYPPRDFVGTDRFAYKLFTEEGDIQVYCTITVTE